VLVLLFNSVATQPTPGVYFTNVGGAGTYNLVTDMLPGSWPPPCPDSPNPCITEQVSIPAHPLAPFDEEVSLQLRGPMDLLKIAIYTYNNNEAYDLTSYWEAANPSATKNISFLSMSGNWTVCGGNALGYCSTDASTASDSPQILQSYLADGLEITVLTAEPCNNDCGYYRGVGMHGWAGDKIFVVEAQMPSVGGTNDDPAIWSLNANIVRTAQYGCNCDRDGCGEFDIAEVVQSGDMTASHTIYSYNGPLGSSGYFPRPTDTYRAFVTHYSILNNRIVVLDMPEGCFQYGNSLSQSYVDSIESVAVSVADFPYHPNTNATFNCNATTTSGSTSSTTNTQQTSTTTATGKSNVSTGVRVVSLSNWFVVYCVVVVAAWLL